MKTQIKNYQLWTYDVWGNTRDGYQVNDRYKQGTISVKVRETVYNPGTEHQFSTFQPSDLQLSRAVSARGCEWEGEAKYTLYATNKRNGKPIGELVRIFADACGLDA